LLKIILDDINSTNISFGKTGYFGKNEKEANIVYLDI